MRKAADKLPFLFCNDSMNSRFRRGEWPITISYLLVMLSFWGATWIFNQRSSQEGAAEKYLNPPPEHIEHFHFGFRESMSDSLWLRWIQDADYCQTYLKPVTYLEPQEVKMDLLTVPRHKICDNSWSFKMLDAITRLAPKFEMPYLAGASTLAILVEDYEGATLMYERGIKELPKNWMLLYRAAFHYQFNLKDLPRAAELLKQAGDNGAPIWVKSLAARLYTVAGQVELGLSTLLEYRKLVEDNEEAVKSVDKRIEELKAQLQSFP